MFQVRRKISLFATVVTVLSANTFAGDKSSVVDLDGKPIVHIGVVVKDIEESTRQLSKLFGVRAWTYIDLEPRKFEQVIIDGEPAPASNTYLKIANGEIMGMHFELMQPISGLGTHSQFLEQFGEGIHHISIPSLTPDEHDTMVENLSDAGVGIEMQGRLAKATTFTYFDTQDELGMLFEVYKNDPNIQSTVEPYIGYQFDGEAALNIKNKSIVQIGMVVSDIEQVAANYENLLGIGPWQVIEVPISKGVFRGEAMPEDSTVTIALAKHEGMGIELIEASSAKNTFNDFYQNNGSGIHHIAFIDTTKPNDPVVHDTDLQVMQQYGLDVEMQGIIFDGTSMFTYIDGKQSLSGITLEMGKGIENK